MSDRPPIGFQIPLTAPYIQESFDLTKLEVGLSTGLGQDFMHYAASPSPIGKNDRGDLRRNDGVDTITSNGMIYTPVGTFTATMTSNHREQKLGASGELDPAVSYLVMPRTYNVGTGVANGSTIYLAPGDRLYFGDSQADDKVINYQLLDYLPQQDNVPMFPIVTLQSIVDSRNITYTQGTDFTITTNGNIHWLDNGNNPGIDVDTGKGRVYAIRYLYKAFYYVYQIMKEVRITNVTVGGVRVPARMPMFPMIVREYIYHNTNKGTPTNQNLSTTPQRVVAAPTQSIDPNKPGTIQVDMSIYRNQSEDKG
jgi:hypothetical protein